MKLKMRKVKSWLRNAKKRYKEKYNIKVEKMIFSKEQLKLVQESIINARKREKEFIKNGGHVVRINNLIKK